MSVLKKSVWKRSKEFDKLKEENFFGTQPIEEVYEARHKKDKFCVMLRVDYGKENEVTYCAVFKNGIKGDLNSKLTWELTLCLMGRSLLWNYTQRKIDA